MTTHHRRPTLLVRFARSLLFTDIYEAIRTADPIDDPTIYRFPAARRRRYERLARFPEGLVVLGDGLCSFNPVYGQGMSVAAVEAIILRDHLKRGHRSSTGRLRSRLAGVVRTPWNMTTAADLAIPAVQGRRSPTVRAANTYISRVLAAAADDTSVGTAFVRVSGLIDQPSALLRPRVALRVLRHRPAARTVAPSPEPFGQRLRSRKEHTTMAPVKMLMAALVVPVLVLVGLAAAVAAIVHFT